MGNNLKALRESLNLKQGEFSAVFGLPQTTYSGYETGQRDPKAQFWVDVADRYQVSVDYLLGMVDDPHRTKYAAMSRVEARYQALDAHGRRVVNLVMDAEAERVAASVEPVAPVVDIRPMIRHYLVPAAAGYASPVQGSDYEMIPLPENAPAGADFCITVRGDSMEPYIPDGSLAYVKRGAPLDEFDVGVFFVSGDVFVKQWCVDMRGTLYLLSANPDREDANKEISKSAAETVVCFGKVLGLKKLPPPEYR